MHVIRIQRSDRNQLFHFCNGDLARSRRNRIEVTSRFPKNEISHRVTLPGLHDSKISSQGPLQNIVPTLKLTHILAFRHNRADTGRSIEGRNSSPPSSQFFS